MFRCGNGTGRPRISSATCASRTRSGTSSAWPTTASGRSLRFGLDGTYDVRPFLKPDLSSPDPLLVGAHENQQGVRNHFLRGRVDEVRFTRAALPPELLLDAGL